MYSRTTVRAAGTRSDGEVQALPDLTSTRSERFYFTLRHLAANMEDFWRQPFGRAGSAIFWLMLLGLAAARASVALYGTRRSSADAFLVLDGAWRMLNGQRPHLDFNSMVGPAAYLPTLVGFRLASNTVAGFGYGQALMALLLGGWAYWLGGKLYQVPRVIYAWCVAAIAVSPAGLGMSPLALSPGMTYNRYGYSLLGILLLECLSTEVASELLAGFSSGAAIAILAFTKMTGFFAGVALLLVLISQRKETARRWVGFGAGAVLVGFPFLWYLHFDVAGVVRDLAITAEAKHVQLVEYLLDSIVLEAGIALLLTLVAFWFLIECGNHRAANRTLVAGISVIAVSVLLIFGNYQFTEMPLLSLLLLMLIQRMLAEHRKGHDILSMVIGGGALFAGITLFSVVVSLADGQWVKVHAARSAPRFESPVLRQFVPVKEDYDYTVIVNHGFDMLRQHRRPGERVMSLDFTNVFSYGLQLPPAAGGSTNLQFDGSFNAQHKVSPEKLFGAADLVMMPKTNSDYVSQYATPKIYGPYIGTHFELIDESPQWKLYRRSTAASKSSSSVQWPP